MNSHWLNRTLPGVLFGSVLLLSVSGCTTGSDIPTPSTPPAVVSAPTPTVTVMAPTAAAITVPADSGIRQGAEGDVTDDANNIPVSYTVVDGDKLGAIGDRFGMDVVELTHPDGSRYDYSNVIIQPGDTITFRYWSPACRSNPTSC